MSNFTSPTQMTDEQRKASALDLHARMQRAILKADPKLKHGANASTLRESQKTTKRLSA